MCELLLALPPRRGQAGRGQGGCRQWWPPGARRAPCHVLLSPAGLWSRRDKQACCCPVLKGQQQQKAGNPIFIGNRIIFQHGQLTGITNPRSTGKRGHSCRARLESSFQTRREGNTAPSAVSHREGTAPATCGDWKRPFEVMSCPSVPSPHEALSAHLGIEVTRTRTPLKLPRAGALWDRMKMRSHPSSWPVDPTREGD